jgi:hypothetical protein
LEEDIMQITKEEFDLFLRKDTPVITIEAPAVTLTIYTVEGDFFNIKAESKFTLDGQRLKAYSSYEGETKLKELVDKAFEKDLTDDEFNGWINHLKENINV